MFIENKVIELFCMSDDFCKFFYSIMPKYTFNLIKKSNKYGVFISLSDKLFFGKRAIIEAVNYELKNIAQV